MRTHLMQITKDINALSKVSSRIHRVLSFRAGKLARVTSEYDIKAFIMLEFAQGTKYT